MITFGLDIVLVLQFTVAVLLPVLVGIVTKKVTRSGVKAALLALFALFTSLITELVASLQRGEVYDLGAGLFLFLPTFVIAVSTHYGFWKPVGASAKVQAIGDTYHNDKTIELDGRDH